MSSVTISLRLDPNLLARIDHNAEREGQTRTDYILGWIPCYYDKRDSELTEDIADRAAYYKEANHQC